MRKTDCKQVIPSILDMTHRILQTAFEGAEEEPNRIAIDTTIGNGYDTCFLAKLVGESGRVVGCDIQEVALQVTQEALVKEGLQSRVTLYQCGHERLFEQLEPEWKGRVSAITANLGYLPRSDKSIMTRPETTRKMLETLLPFLRIGGVMTVVAYGGHVGGQEEVNQVHSIVSELPQAEFRVLQYAFLNITRTPPILYAIERIGIE